MVLHWLLLALGIAAATDGLRRPQIAAPIFFGLIPVPLVFYVITYKYTIPHRSGVISTPEGWF